MAHYLDNSATTPLCPQAKAAMTAAMERYGNPSSLHTLGALAAKELKACRTAVGEALGERFLADGQLLFTASGTEANALALQGTAHAKERRAAKTILTTDSEHPSVENNLRVLEREGFTVVRVATKGGALDMDAVRAHCNRDLFLVSMMLVNNETGAKYPVAEVFRLARAANPGVICHTDAVQGFLKVPFTPTGLGADLVSVSAHKIGGPKGVGALFVSQRVLKERYLVPHLPGGGQEFGLRSGTENTIGIAGFAAAAKAGAENVRGDMAHIARLREQLLEALADTEISVNIPASPAPHIISLTLPQIKSETMLHFLSEKDIFVSSGSACSSHKKGPSGVLVAFGLAPDRADTTIRVSLAPHNTAKDIAALAAALKEGMDTLIRMK